MDAAWHQGAGPSVNSVRLFVCFYLGLGLFPFLLGAVVNVIGLVESAWRPREPRPVVRDRVGLARDASDCVGSGDDRVLRRLSGAGSPADS